MMIVIYTSLLSAPRRQHLRHDVRVDCCDNDFDDFNAVGLRCRCRHLHLQTEHQSQRSEKGSSMSADHQRFEAFKLLSPCSIR